jgi:hypothetical protein
VTQTSPHEWLRPRLAALVAEAAAAGIARDVSVAVITDLINGPLSAATPPPSPDNPNQDIGEPDYMASDATGTHPSLPDEPGGYVGNPLNHLGRGGRFGGGSAL